MRAAYEELHRLGHAHSVEVRLDGALVGGLYGVALGKLFAGESMFSSHDGASKVAVVALVGQLQRWGFGLIDSQVHTETLAAMGAQEITREEYLRALPQLVGAPSRPGPWTLEKDWSPTSRP